MPRDYQVDGGVAYLAGRRRPGRNAWQSLGPGTRRRLRDACIAIHGPWCWQCGQRATEADHVIPVSAGGTNEVANLRPSCGRCNRSRSNGATGDGAYGAVVVLDTHPPEDACMRLDVAVLAAALAGVTPAPDAALLAVARAAYTAALAAARRLPDPVVVWAVPDQAAELAGPPAPPPPSRQW
jgi:hypothetical protein